MKNRKTEIDSLQKPLQKKTKNNFEIFRYFISVYSMSKFLFLSIIDTKRTC